MVDMYRNINASFLPTAYVVRGKVMFSVCSHLGGGGTPARSDGGYPCWGVPHLGYPPVVPGRGVPQWGGYPIRGVTPPQVPPCWTGGTRGGGFPHLRYDLSWTWLGGTLAGGRYPNGGYPISSTPPPIGHGEGVPQQGVPTLDWGGITTSGTLLSDLAGGYPAGGGGTPPRTG